MPGVSPSLATACSFLRVLQTTELLYTLFPPSLSNMCSRSTQTLFGVASSIPAADILQFLLLVPVIAQLKSQTPVSGKVMHTLTGFKSGVESLSFDNSGENLCTAFMDGSIIVWMDIHNSSSLPVGLLVHSEIVRLCRFISLDSNKFILISSSHYHSLTLLDIRESMSLLHSEEIPLENVIVRDVKSSVKRVQQFDGHCNFVWSVCCLESKSLSKTKAVLVSCSSDKTIRYL